MDINPFKWPPFGFLLIATVVSGAPVPVLNVVELVEQSDLVAMGRVTWVTDAGPISIETPNGSIAARTMAGEMAVDQILKGPSELASIRFNFALPEVAMGYRGVASGTYRILFLKRRGNNHYEFTSPYYPSVVARPGSHVRADGALDRVVEAVATVLRSRDASMEQKREAINVLWRVKTAASLAGLRWALQESDRTLQLNAAAALLFADDISALPIAEAALLRAEPGIPPEVFLNIRGGISRGLKTEAAIPALGRLLSAREAETRRAAASALRNTRSTSAIAGLARALDDNDLDVKHTAVMGLAEITGRREWGPSREAFGRDQERYLLYWKEWVRTR